MRSFLSASGTAGLRGRRAGNGTAAGAGLVAGNGAAGGRAIWVGLRGGSSGRGLGSRNSRSRGGHSGSRRRRRSRFLLGSRLLRGRRRLLGTRLGRRRRRLRLLLRLRGRLLGLSRGGRARSLRLGCLRLTEAALLGLTGDATSLLRRRLRLGSNRSSTDHHGEDELTVDLADGDGDASVLSVEEDLSVDGAKGLSEQKLGRGGDGRARSVRVSVVTLRRVVSIALGRLVRVSSVVTSLVTLVGVSSRRRSTNSGASAVGTGAILRLSVRLIGSSAVVGFIVLTLLARSLKSTGSAARVLENGTLGNAKRDG